MEHKINWDKINKGLKIIKEIERVLKLTQVVTRIACIDDYPNSKMFKIEYMVNRKRKQITRRYNDNNKAVVYQEMEKLIRIHREQLKNDSTFKSRSSEYKGVTWHKPSKKWHAQIRHNGKHIHIGSFKDEKEAGRAYNAKAKELHGEYAKLNVID